jgi:hypothetical protein
MHHTLTLPISAVARFRIFEGSTEADWRNPLITSHFAQPSTLNVDAYVALVARTCIFMSGTRTPASRRLLIDHSA